MEIYRGADTYFRIREPSGKTPVELSGIFTSEREAQRAIELFQSGVRKKIKQNAKTNNFPTTR